MSTRSLQLRVVQKSALAALLAAFLAGFSGCGTGSDAKTDTSTQKQLLSTDLDQLSTYKSSGAEQYDLENGGVFTQIFGGTSGSDLTNYLNTRVHYYVDRYEDVSVTPGDFTINGWTKDQDTTTNAQNIGIEYWIMGLINNVNVTFDIQDQTVDLTSGRTGIVLLDDGYSTQIEFNGEEVDMPSFYRQSILLHEARHSDCTGGLTQRQLGQIVQDQSAAEFTSHDDAGHCGHLHVLCPSGAYEGLYACDDETYGAYGIQNIFLKAQILQLEIDGEDHTLADAMQIDAESRLLSETTDPFPDMSSTDTISP